MKSFWVFLVGLLVIHTLDMVLTDRCIGDNWENEIFLPMRCCIRHLGIYNALWVSRICTYSYLWVTVYYRDVRSVRITLAIVTSCNGLVYKSHCKATNPGYAFFVSPAHSTQRGSTVKNLLLVAMLMTMAFGAGVLAEKNCHVVQKLVGCPCCCCVQCPKDCCDKCPADCCKTKCGCGDKCKCKSVKLDLAKQAKYIRDCIKDAKDSEEVPCWVEYLRHLCDQMDAASNCQCCSCSCADCCTKK